MLLRRTRKRSSHHGVRHARRSTCETLTITKPSAIGRLIQSEHGRRGKGPRQVLNNTLVLTVYATSALHTRQGNEDQPPAIMACRVAGHGARALRTP